MAGAGIFGFLDLPPPEEEPAPHHESPDRTPDQVKGVSVSKAASFFPTLSTAGLLHDSDSDDGLLLPRPGQVPQDVLAVACEPPAEAFPGLPTHVILKVLSVQGIPVRKEERNVPGHKGLGYFLEGKNVIDRSTAASAAFAHPSELRSRAWPHPRPPLPSSRKRRAGLRAGKKQPSPSRVTLQLLGRLEF